MSNSNEQSPEGMDDAHGVDSTKAPGGAPGAKPHSPVSFEDVISGAFDDEGFVADVPAVEEEVAKRVLAPELDSPKLHKVLAQAGMGSRLEMEQLIIEGRISVNGEPAHVGQRVKYGDAIKVNGRAIRVRIDPPAPRVLAYHKPAGEVVTHDDPQNRPTVFRRLPRLQHGKWQSVGRLDLNTEGLLLFTSSGTLANQLMHPRFGLQREYAVRVLGALSNAEKQQLLDGVQLEDGPAQFATIVDGGGEGSNHWYRVTIGEGRNREVRRMIEAVGHAVSRLIRIRYGSVELPRGLRRGAFVELDWRDIEQLSAAANEAVPVAGGGRALNPQAGKSGRTAGLGRTVKNSYNKRSGGRRPSTPQGWDARAELQAEKKAVRQQPKRGQRLGAARALLVPVAPEAQPDPMQTSFGYIGGDALQRQRDRSAPGAKRVKRKR
jgi:23S rRNA pseudouridine2605 synthase